MRLLTRIVKCVEADGPQQVVDHQRRLDVGGDRQRADRVEVALHELAVAAALRVLAAPHRGDVVALERRAQLVDVLGDEARQRHRQVEPHADVAPAVVLKAVELLVGLVAPLAERGFRGTRSAGVSIGLSRTSDRRAARVSISRSRAIIASGR